MELSKREIEMALDNPAFAPTLPARTLPRFDAADLARVLLAECNRAELKGLSHVGLNMNLTDCRAMARFLIRAVLAGV